jgi:acyl carrier protein
MNQQAITEVVFDALRLANKSRPPDRQLAVTADSPLFGHNGALDSLGLVALVIDIEDGLRDRGFVMDLSSAQALSPRNSPFRSVQTLIDYIAKHAS